MRIGKLHWIVRQLTSRMIIEMQIQSANINLGETILHLLTLGDDGNMQLKKKFTQNQVIAFTGNLQTSLTGMEASSGAHFLGRALRETKVMT